MLNDLRDLWPRSCQKLDQNLDHIINIRQCAQMFLPPAILPGQAWVVN